MATVTAPDQSFGKTDSVDLLYEVINGQKVELEPMGTRQELTAGEMHGYLHVYAKKAKTGRAAVETLFDFTNQLGKKRRPDVAFVSFERWPMEQTIPEGDGWKVIPNLAVEVVSPTNTWDAIQEKVQEYFQVGVEMVWVVSTAKQQVHVYNSPTSLRILTNKDELSDDQILPGFRLPLSELFESNGTE